MYQPEDWRRTDAHEVPGSDPVPPQPPQEPPEAPPTDDPDDPVHPGGVPVREPLSPRPPLHVAG